ncbi:MAG: hypothetical protein ONB43_03490 [candidate division KSB1 bacterium]|nr:hypothetical protein [candidate division KSB1 bacterium]MDZ7403026.1 hypothetical protein [candidate division KSB1 bacterium]
MKQKTLRFAAKPRILLKNDANESYSPKGEPVARFVTLIPEKQP